MPTGTPPDAAGAAEADAGTWAELATAWREEERPGRWAERPPREAAVVVFHDPAEDLARRAAAWGHELPGVDLGHLAAFAAGLARVEAEAWRSGAGDVAMRAYGERRSLLGDRILHWAVPWLDAVARRHRLAIARRHRDLLLALGDEHRPAPRLTGGEGLHPPGEDSFGPVEPALPLGDLLRSLWSGAVLLGPVPHDPAPGYAAAARRWRRLAARHPGSAALWWDLAERASSTARRVVAERGGDAAGARPPHR